ncbi:MAG TPA: bacillithiol biosynthesis cysteine-adding enzyme BshC [Polyangia bacterium]|nr:bacillithiol biosynthesis cysteine-adding enzyme BshC [Polyangia bacterium]
MARPFSSAYLAGDAATHGFLPRDFRSAADRAASARAAVARRAAPAVVAALRAQHARLPASAARAEQLDALAAGETAIVATGQQVGLFLGPLYGFYKAASAVAVARALTAETGVRCVPLFWLQTEDHDFAEIAGATIAAADGKPVRLVLADERGGEGRVAIAHRTLGSDVVGLLDALADLLGPSDAASETLALLRAHYVAGRPLADAFAGVLAALFADEGLLILDPRDPGIARAAAPIYAEALRAAPEIEARLQARCAALAEAGFAAQIPIRPGCALLFHHCDAAEGPRYRLERRRGEADGWFLSGGDARVADAALAETLAREPLRFSTSALLRPIVQDTLLPVAATVGGPAEVSYFAQLPPVYEHFGLPSPLAIPRARFRCRDARTRRVLGELALAPDDLARSDADLAAQIGGARPAKAAAPLAARVATEILPAVDALTAAVAEADPADRNLVRAASRTRAAVARALDRLTARHARKLAARDQVTLARLARLRDALAPGGVPQERAYAWPSLAGRIGPAAFKRLVMDRLASVGPYVTELQEIDA